MSIDIMSAVWRYGPTNSTERFVLLSIADRADEIGYCYPSYNDISKRCVLSRPTVIKAIHRMRKAGWIRTEAEFKDDGSRSSNGIYINFEMLGLEAPGGKDTLSPQVRKRGGGSKETLPGVVKERDQGSKESLPKSSINHQSEPSLNHQNEPSTASPATPPPPPAAVAAGDPLTPILTWFGFEDALTPKERTALDVATLLAWAYWVKLTQAEQGSRVRNPVGLVRAQWRKGTAPRADLHRLARGWIVLDDDRRARLLGRLEWSVAYGQYDPGESLDDEFPDVPIATAAAVFAATAGELGPPSLMPPREAIPSRPAPRNEAPQSQQPLLTSPQLWCDALDELEMQMSKATFTSWLLGTTAAETDEGLTIHVRNEHAAEWLSQRLHPVIERTVAGLARRPLSIHYEVRDVT